jgi:hypothetical protein
LLDGFETLRDELGELFVDAGGVGEFPVDFVVGDVFVPI